jgi:methionine synthase I (cobalamin-dependent)
MTSRNYTNHHHLEALEKRVPVFDGAMGTTLQMQIRDMNNDQ